MATPAAAGAATPTAANATTDAPEPSYAEATSSLERLKAQAALSDLDREQMECQDTDEGDDIIPHDTDTPTTRIEQDEDKEGDWQTVLTIRQKKALARAGRKTVGAGGGYDSSSQHLGPPKKPPLKKKPRANRLPPLPKEDFKIIVRPHQGLPIKELTAPQISEAVIIATQRKVRGEHFLLRLKPGSNIFIISTPKQEVADIVRKITTLVINGKQHAVKAYVTAGEDTKKGVVHGLSPHTSPETLQANLRIRTQGVEILRARMLGESKTAVITFYGPMMHALFTTWEEKCPVTHSRIPYNSAKRAYKQATGRTCALNLIPQYATDAALKSQSRSTNVNPPAPLVERSILPARRIARNGSKSRSRTTKRQGKHHPEYPKLRARNLHRGHVGTTRTTRKTTTGHH